MTLVDQIIGKYYQMKISEYAVSGNNDWQNFTKYNFIVPDVHFYV